jgi:diguanylate cyclase (GGDEF)-like protein
MKSSTILVVDDELFFRRLYANLLNENGYQVETASSGEEAVTRLARGDIDIVLADLVMPGLDGMQLLDHCRKRNNPPDVVLVTGHASVESAIQALKNGARDYLVKPFDPTELLHVVRTCLEQRHLLDENTVLKAQIQLYQRGQHLASHLDFDHLFDEALSAILQEAGGGRGLACLMNDGEITELAGTKSLQETEAMALIDVLKPFLTQGIELCILSGEELPAAPQLPQGLQTVGIFPMRSAYGLHGAMVFCNPLGYDFAPDLPRDNLIYLLEQAALGFENACRFKSARDLIFIDDLTGLHNYRYLQMILEQEIVRAERYGLEFSLVFIDLDFFKEVNDTRGHLAGSQALKEVAILLKQCVRESDILFRYGGDEFTGFLVETGCEGAAVVAERIRQSIEDHVFFSDSSNPARITATVGYATFPSDAGTQREIMHLADKAMYAGKRCRNAVRGAWQLAEQEEKTADQE